MNWEGPSFVEVKMDAEINSYQDDLRDAPGAKEPPTEPSLLLVKGNGERM